MGKIEDFFDPAECRVEIEELPDGGCVFHYELTGNTKLFVERKAAQEGLSVEDYLRQALLQDMPSNDR